MGQMNVLMGMDHFLVRMLFKFSGGHFLPLLLLQQFVLAERVAIAGCR
jgi:hypothetical protein